MLEFLSQPWPWWVAGPLVGLMVPLLFWVGSKRFGVSSSFRHVCAAVAPAGSEYLKYDWRKEAWNLFLVAGIAVGAFLAAWLIPNPEAVAISESTASDLAALGVTDQTGLVPKQIFSWESLLSVKGLIFIVVGGFLVGFGTRYADGCTSGHAIAGLSNFELSSLVATIAFFVGGLVVTWLIYPLIF